jgi:hypothetical protein
MFPNVRILKYTDTAADTVAGTGRHSGDKPGQQNCYMLLIFLPLTKGEHTGSPLHRHLRCDIIDIIDNSNHGNDM